MGAARGRGTRTDKNVVNDREEVADGLVLVDLVDNIEEAKKDLATVLLEQLARHYAIVLVHLVRIDDVKLDLINQLRVKVLLKGARKTRREHRERYK